MATSNRRRMTSVNPAETSSSSSSTSRSPRDRARYVGYVDEHL